MTKIVTLCGSTRFKKDFERWNKELTLWGHIVLAPGCFGHIDKDSRIDANKDLLDSLHIAKIEMSDFVFVIDKSNYIGESTKKEIEYALSRGIEVLYASKCTNTWMKKKSKWVNVPLVG